MTQARCSVCGGARRRVRCGYCESCVTRLAADGDAAACDAVEMFRRKECVTCGATLGRLNKTGHCNLHARAALPDDVRRAGALAGHRDYAAMGKAGYAASFGRMTKAQRGDATRAQMAATAPSVRSARASLASRCADKSKGALSRWARMSEDDRKAKLAQLRSGQTRYAPK